MIFGYNTDVKSGDIVYHVQTEDRGEKNPVIDSVVYVKGRIVERRRTPYDPAQTPPERLQDMVKQQHRTLVDTIRSGNYAPPADDAPEPPPASAAAAAAPAPATVPQRPAAEPVLELLNPGEIEAEGGLVFRMSVRDGATGQPLAGSLVEAVLLWPEAAEARAQATASAEGVAEVAFQQPQGETAALVVRVLAGGLATILRLRLSKA
jgi:hypothetical protein